MKLHILLLALTLGVAAAASAQSTWPQWRGPNRDDQFTDPAWPDKLDTNHLRQRSASSLARVTPDPSSGVFHLSSPLAGWSGAKLERHHDYIAPSDFSTAWKHRALTVEVEAKAKELAFLKLLADLRATG